MLVADSSDISVLSVHESFFIFPSQHHLAICADKHTHKKTICCVANGINQLTDYSNKPHFISCSEVKQFSWIHQQQQLRLSAPPKMISN